MNKIDNFNSTFKDAYTRLVQVGTGVSSSLGYDTTTTFGDTIYTKYGFDIRQVL